MVNKDDSMNKWLVFSNISNMLRAGLLALAALGGIMAACAAPAGAQGTVTGNDQYTVFLLQSEAPNGSRVFTDSSAGHTEPHPITAVGNIWHSTAQAKFGTSSIWFDGTTHFTVPDSDDWFIDRDYTIDLWVWFGSFPRTDSTFVSQNDGSLWYFFTAYFGTRLYWEGPPRAAACVYSFSTGRWYHLAFTTRASTQATTSRLFIDGVLMDENSGPGYFINRAAPLWIGNLSGYDYPFRGFMEELRISKGICRWTANFTPPSGPYPAAPPTATPTVIPTATPAPVPAAAWPGLMLLVAALTGLLVCRRRK